MSDRTPEKEKLVAQLVENTRLWLLEHTGEKTIEPIRIPVIKEMMESDSFPTP